MPPRIFVKIYIKEEHLCWVYTIKPRYKWFCAIDTLLSNECSIFFKTQMSEKKLWKILDSLFKM